MRQTEVNHFSFVAHSCKIYRAIYRAIYKRLPFLEASITATACRSNLLYSSSFKRETIETGVISIFSEVYLPVLVPFNAHHVCRQLKTRTQNV